MMTDRQPILGMWLVVVAVLVGLTTPLMPEPSQSLVLVWALLAFGFGVWWAVADNEAMVIWVPWDDAPTVYYLPRAVKFGPDDDVAFSAELERAIIRAWLWVAMGWRVAARSWIRTSMRWDVLVQVCAERADYRIAAGHPPSAAVAEESNWLQSTVTSYILGRNRFQCSVAIGKAMHANTVDA